MDEKQSTQPPLAIPSSRKNYVARLFSGRLNRQNYLVGSTLFTIPPLLCFFIITFNSVMTVSALPYLDLNSPEQIQNAAAPSLTTIAATPFTMIIASIGAILFVVSLPYLLSLQVRRLHDLNHSGWYILLNFVPFVAYLLSLYVAFWPGTTKRNTYGEVTLLRTSITSDILRINQ